MVDWRSRAEAQVPFLPLKVLALVSELTAEVFWWAESGERLVSMKQDNRTHK
jgi:hypothetical protein